MAVERLKVQVWIYARDTQGKIEVLLLKMLPERGGHWQPVTGGVDPGEVIDAAALREATEETGLPFLGGPEPLGYEFTFESQYGKAHETVYGLEAVGARKPKLDPKEHVSFQWVGAEKAAAFLSFDSNREGLRRLLAYVQRRPS